MAQVGSYFGQMVINSEDNTAKINGEELASEKGIALILDDETGGLKVNDRDDSQFGTPGYGSLTIAGTTGDGNYDGATGSYAIAFGYDVTSSGYASFARGGYVKATNHFALASGYDVEVSGYGATAFGANSSVTKDYGFTTGRYNEVSNWYANALGNSLKANSYCVTVVGQANTDYTFNSSLNADENPVFIVGNGDINAGTNDASSRSDALVVYLGGEVVAPSLDTDGIDAADDKVLVTKEWVLAKLAE